MAFFPCDKGPHPNPKRNINFYVGYLSGLETSRQRRRVCDRHWGEIHTRLAEYEVDPVDAADHGVPARADCATCGQPILEDRAQVFVTAYPTQNDRKDYWLGIHPTCFVPGWLWEPE